MIQHYLKQKILLIFWKYLLQNSIETTYPISNTRQQVTEQPEFSTTQGV
jgi:hypothetical protein